MHYNLEPSTAKINAIDISEKVTQYVTPAVDLAAASEFLAIYGPDRQLCTLKEGGGMMGLRGATMLQDAEARNLNQEAVYFTPNTVKPGVNKKARSADITHITAVGIDVDWGWATNAGNFRAAHAITMAKADALKALPHLPSVIVSTGGGLQAFWILSIPVDAQEFKVRAEALGKTLAETWGGDNVQNIDRVFRLPGFINYPKKSKRDAGQLPASVKVIFTCDRRNTLEELESAFPKAGGAAQSKPSTRPPIVSPGFEVVPSHLVGLPKDNDLAEGIGVPDIDELKSLSAALEGKLGDRDDWFDFTKPMANLAAEFPLLNDPIFNIYNDTCAKSPGYEAASVRAKFEEMIEYANARSGTGQPLTGMTTLRAMAAKHGWLWPAENAQRDAIDNAMSMGIVQPKPRGVDTGCPWLAAARYRLHVFYKIGGADAQKSRRLIAQVIRELKASDPQLTKEIAPSLAMLLARQGSSPAYIQSSAVFCGLSSDNAASLTNWTLNTLHREENNHG